MIRIKKGPSPGKLELNGREQAKLHCAEYEAQPTAFRENQKRFSFNENIYGHTSVRNRLKGAQNQKCCYCEVVVPEPYATFHIEHWRPKARARQSKTEPLTYLGYYWLAYEWDNLLLSCLPCNQAKGIWFPLVDDALRADPATRSVIAEEPLLLKPDGDDDPSVHIRFVEEIPIGITERGRRTIEILQLDALKHDKRRGRLSELKRVHLLLLASQGSGTPDSLKFSEKARAFVELAIQPEAEYSAMANTYVESKFERVEGFLFARP